MDQFSKEVINNINQNGVGRSHCLLSYCIIPPKATISMSSHVMRDRDAQTPLDTSHIRAKEMKFYRDENSNVDFLLKQVRIITGCQL